jgi:uncharacterized membrane protein YfcA
MPTPSKQRSSERDQQGSLCVRTATRAVARRVRGARCVLLLLSSCVAAAWLAHSAHLGPEQALQRALQPLQTFFGVAGEDPRLFGGGAPRSLRREAWVCGAFVVAGFVQGVAGFGCGMVAMAILPSAMPLIDVVPIVGVFTGLCNFCMMVQLRGSLDSSVFEAMPLLISGQMAGVPLGVMLLQTADPHWLRLLLGVTMLIFVAHEHLEKEHGEERGGIGDGGTMGERAKSIPSSALVLPGGRGQQQRQNTRQMSRWWGLPFGLVSGVLSGALNEGGPPAVVYVTLRKWDKDRVKVALQVRAGR